MLPSDSDMADLYSQLRYSTGEFQALEVIVFVVCCAVYYPLDSCVLVQFSKLVLNDSWFVSMT